MLATESLAEIGACLSGVATGMITKGFFLWTLKWDTISKGTKKYDELENYQAML